jgi:hypothetical protein
MVLLGLMLGSAIIKNTLVMLVLIQDEQCTAI